jgi:DNA excision repair protein ERCC-2
MHALANGFASSYADACLPLQHTRFCYDRLSSLMKTLEITNTDDFLAIQMVADFGTLLGTYSRGFAVIIEPYDERLPHIPDPVLQLRWACFCLFCCVLC